jgi:hypothetical protein
MHKCTSTRGLTNNAGHGHKEPHVVSDDNTERAHHGVHLPCGTRRCPPRMSGMAPNPHTSMHSHALPLPYLLGVDSSLVDALDMHPLPMLQNGADWILLITCRQTNVRRGTILGVQAALPTEAQ